MPSISEVAAIAKSAVGFFEEAPGVKSSTRLIGICCLGLAATITGVMDWYVIRQTLHEKLIDPNVLLALVAGIAGFVANGAVAIAKRTKLDGCDPS